MARGGKRQGAGAPAGNKNRLLHGRRSRDPHLKLLLSAHKGQETLVIERLKANRQARLRLRAQARRLIEGGQPSLASYLGVDVTNISQNSAKVPPTPDRRPNLRPQLDGPADSAKFPRKERLRPHGPRPRQPLPPLLPGETMPQWWRRYLGLQPGQRPRITYKFPPYLYSRPRQNRPSSIDYLYGQQD